MFIDVLERLFDVTGDRKYHDFTLWFYKERSRRGQVGYQCYLPRSIRKGLFGHGVPTYENIRVPLWLGCETGRRDLHWAAQNALIKIGR